MIMLIERLGTLCEDWSSVPSETSQEGGESAGNLNNGLSYTIDIGLVLEIVHWTMLSSNFIALQQELPTEIVQLQTQKYFPHFFIISKMTRERINISKRF